MRAKVLITVCFSMIVFFSLTLWAADNVAPLNVKEGLWEVTVVHSMTGMPTSSMANIPPDALAKMTPDQRARVEAMMGGKPSTDVRKECVTKEKLEKNAAFSNTRGECTRTVVNSTGRKLEVKFHCEEKQSVSDGNFVMEAIGSDNVKGTMHMVANTGSGHNMTMDLTITSKFLGQDCGEVK
ncbi:MAG: DUF3617 domain-containing protein [Terriglobales bacterium]|jgi:hypothetical protein